MTRKKFFRLCQSADGVIDGDRVSLRLSVGRNTNREVVIKLHGSWADGCIPVREIYCPLPGRQGRDCYAEATRKVQEKLVTYERWLEEHKFQVEFSRGLESK